MNPNELEQVIRDLLRQPMADADLRGRLEQLAQTEISFAGFTWLWGPELYRRNRVLFRPVITSRFSSYMTLPKWRVETIAWKADKAVVLDAWLTEVDKNNDSDLFRKLYEWKLQDRFDWAKRGDRSKEIRRDLLDRFRKDSSPAQRQITLRKFDLWFDLDEESSCALYEKDRAAAGPFILKHLQTAWYGGEKRQLWNRLIKLAEVHKDDDFRWKLYRRQVPVADWTRDCLALCAGLRDNAKLVRDLEKRHIEGYGFNLADPFYQIVQTRGRDVFPYVMRHLRQVWGGWLGRGSYGKMADLARDRGWWELWSALIRTCSGPKEFNREVEALVSGSALAPEEQLRRLLALTGVSREWNWGGFGAAAVHQLDEKVALAMYERFPDLLRGPFKLHVQAHVWGESYPKLLNRFIEVEDDEMIDYLASRLVTRSGRWGNVEKMVTGADRLAGYYGGLKTQEAAFSRRASNVLGQVPAYSIWNYNELIRQNPLARLLFERSAAAYLADEKSMADLVEGAEIHVQALAYRALGLNDSRAKELAAQNLPLLMGTLLRPLQRDTRVLAFGALANAAVTLENARLILQRAQDAMNLPDKRYPKEKLLALIARLLHAWPELRSPAEQPVIYERAA